MTSRVFSRIGIVGAGQLGRMLGQAAIPLGISCAFLDRSAQAPGARVGPILVGNLEDPKLLEELASQCEVLTFDWENISAAALAPLRRLVAIRPSAAALGVSQDRLLEKALFRRLKIPVAPHAAVDGRSDLIAAIERLGLPGVLKTRKFGYDGKGQYVIRNCADIDAAHAHVGAGKLLYEKFLSFASEVSIIGARGATGECAFYPLSRNHHAGGILRYGLAPHRDRNLERQARLYMRRVLHDLRYVGVLAIEFFVIGGKLIANEMAPRVHNSGHWTIDGCVTSQFENHLRAICGMPLGSTQALGHTAMINFLGTMPDRERLLAIDGLAFHDYGKAPRPGRKLGHCTIVKARVKDRNRALENALNLVRWT